jgi:hypothetical protein
MDASARASSHRSRLAGRGALVVAMTLAAVVLASAAQAETVTIEASAALADRSEAALDGALDRAIETTIRSAAAMGFTMVRFDRAIVLEDRVVVRIVASDSAGDDVEEADVPLPAPGKAPGTLL